MCPPPPPRPPPVFQPPPRQPQSHPPPPQPSPRPRQPLPPPPQQQPPSRPPQPQQLPPQEPPPQLQYPQYPYNYQHPRPKKSTPTLASCFLATSFLIFLTIAAIITCYILFRPQNPQISVHSMKFPSFSLLNGTANFTFFQYVAVRNPNRYDFSHYDSSLHLFSSSAGPLGFMYIPAGRIAAGRTQFLSATFDVKSFPLPPDVGLAGGPPVGPGSGPGPTIELETKMKLVGSVKVLKVFAHHVEKGAQCRVTIQISDGSVLGYNC
ncbi:hypothetical protein BVRB_1g003020 [Beta vulgaris subsp. vulgaris]|uniref:uncharacterized protein LOC104883387 n=1 Tax=Beta vulgaris subsp. vulgaris TaxID=3555 RepID=UPI0005402DFC|nr:uncharacterized protein LOC104883387 [Beta vulgaris subsp. vulgaris]KMT20299.1 hypothetical protein BVRB_1g003020 [Beta vulgaris subsp. vulgaris]